MTTQKPQPQFAMTPAWILHRQGLSLNAKAVYGGLMLYVSHDPKKANYRKCWPGYERLASDLGTSESTIKRAINELKKVGAVIVTKRNTSTGPNSTKTNEYRMVFDEPTAHKMAGEPKKLADTPQAEVTGDPCTEVTGDPVTRAREPEPLLTPSDGHLEESFSGDGTEDPDQAGDLPEATRARLRGCLQAVGQSVADSQPAQHTRQKRELFLGALRAETAHLPYTDELMDLATNRWSITAEAVAPYEAGKQLNILLNMARRAG